jgi:hypothetical protein
MNRIAQSGIGLTLLLVVAGLPAIAQSPAPAASPSAGDATPLGTYARQIRKDSGATAKLKVFDNDNLPTDDKLSIVGTAPAPGANATEAKQEDSANAPAGETKDAKPGEAKPGADDKNKPTDQAAKEAAWKQWSDRIAQQQSQIDLNARELDVLQREYQIRAAAMYADAGNRLRNSGDWDKQDAQYKQQIADKQKALDDAKQKLDDMQEEARKAGVPSSVREP